MSFLEDQFWNEVELGVIQIVPLTESPLSIAMRLLTLHSTPLCQRHETAFPKKI